MDAEDLVGELVVEIGDYTFHGVGSGAVVFFAAFADEALDGSNLTEEERGEFEAHAKMFIDSFGEVIRINDEALREVALQAIESAFYMSLYHAGSPQTRQRLKAALEKARTKSANMARSRPDIKEVIERRVREQWKLDSELMDKPYKTAEIVCGDVIKDISKLSEVPKEWKVEDPDHPTETDLKKAVDRVRKQIERIQQPDK